MKYEVKFTSQFKKDLKLATAEHHPGCLNDNCRDRAHHHRVMGLFCGGGIGFMVGFRYKIMMD